MYTLNDKLQFQAWAIKHGRHKLSVEHREILDWISNQFGVSVLDFSYEGRATSNVSPQQLIHLILETVDEVKKMQADRHATAMIAERFSKLLKSGHSENAQTDLLKCDIFPSETLQGAAIIVTYRPLKQTDGKLVAEMLEDEKRALLKTFESVWTISQSVVFYYTDLQVKENSATGISAKIVDALRQRDEKYEFERGADYRFDSKETFDRDYESNWYYYWK